MDYDYDYWKHNLRLVIIANYENDSSRTADVMQQTWQDV